MPGSEGERVLIAAPFGRDAATLAALLDARGFRTQTYARANDMASGLGATAGLMLITEEALRGDLTDLQRALTDQPVWSDVPVVLLAARQPARLQGVEVARAHLPPNATNVVVLERPLGAESLSSAVESALRSRRRQFEMRDRLDEIARAAATLENKVAERTAELEAELAHRSQIEATLRQSQKMESIGHLTGGIAHDFNNMLTGVIGSLAMMRRRLDAGRLDDLDRYMEAAFASAQRAATLTQRLLAFSRRQSLDTKPTDVNALVTGLRELLERTVHERISLRIVTGDGLPSAMVDGNQLESALLNLVINARDAMPDGGLLTIETRPIKVDQVDAADRPGLDAGAYVMIAVSDTGVGMSPEVIEKVFDPFFTTKPVGQGTGLGLSMVYGFAQQSGGQVRIHSRPGEGASVKIYLPASHQAAEAESAAPERAVCDGKGRAVLLVEDDDSVRLLISSVLEEFGYQTVKVADPRLAVPILESGRRFDLLISDVGLPGMTGRQLADIARRRRPELPILFVTGYAENAAIRAGFLGLNMDMIAKPFSLEDLTAKVADMLQPIEH